MESGSSPTTSGGASQKRKREGSADHQTDDEDTPAPNCCDTTLLEVEARSNSGRHMTELMTRLFGKHDVGVAIRPSPSDPNNYGVYATRPLAAGELIGGSQGGIAASAVLDPVDIIGTHPLAKRAIEIANVSPSFAFWLALASMAKSAEAYTDEKCTDTDTGMSHVRRYKEYLASLPRESPEPCSWSEDERRLLKGTLVGKQVDNQLRLLRAEYDRVVSVFGQNEDTSDISIPLDIPFDIDGRGKYPSLLWARGMHLSRSFPRSLVDAARLELKEGGTASQDPVLRVQLGGFRAPRIEYTGPKDESPSPAAACGNTDIVVPDPNEIAGTLGIMTPFWGMLDHEAGHPIVWEAGDGYIRFRCVDAIEEGQEIKNNYGPKGNQELLFTYGFAIEGNPMDSVDGIMIGCRIPPADATDEEDRILVHKGTLELLREHDIQHKIENGALLIGPFSLHGAPPNPSSQSTNGDRKGREYEGGNNSTGVLSPELLFALSVIGMETLEEGPGLSLDEIEMLKGELGRRIDALDTDESYVEMSKQYAVRSSFCSAYKRGQRSLLQKALAELGAMVEGEA